MEKLLSSLYTHKSAAELAPYLADIFILSFTTGEIPQHMKNATITPVPKAGNPCLPTNYRSISFLSILSKVQEIIILLSSIYMEALHRAVWSAGVWLKEWHLLVNTHKTVIMHFYNDNRPQNTLPTITLDGKRLDTLTLWHHFSTQPTLDTSHRAYLKKNIQIINILIFYFACNWHYITALSPESI